MNIILVPSSLTTNEAIFTAGGVSSHSTFYDPMSSVSRFMNIWGENHSKSKFIYDGDLRLKSWDRAEFTDLIKKHCKSDVYIQVSNGGIQILFTDPNDHDVFTDDFNLNNIYSQFNSELATVIRDWIKQEGEPEHKEIYTGSTYSVAFRDPYYRTLVRLKFTNTTPADHRVDDLDDVPF